VQYLALVVNPYGKTLIKSARPQERVLVVVLIFKAWEGVYEGSLVAQTMGVDEGNKIDSLWELMKEIKEIQYGS
jgi:hypothetical protein